jgi:hypothetical protein
MRKYPPPQLFIFLFALLFQFSGAFAQTRTLTGTVKDSVNQPLSAATVKVKGQKSSTATAADGSFSLSVPPGNITLEVSYVGFSPMTVPVSADQTNVNVMMQQNIKHYQRCSCNRLRYFKAIKVACICNTNC